MELGTVAPSSLWPALPRLIGIVAPALYCGFTLSDSLTFVQPIVEHAPNDKTMAKQWLRGYQYGPKWVPPLIIPGALSNAYLATLASARGSSTLSTLYLAAALCIFSVAPITFLYMEPGINGALKWKVETLLVRDDPSHPRMRDTPLYLPHAHRHGSTPATRRWAERTDIKTLILFWRRVNNFRWVIGGVAALLSGWATVAQVPSL